MDCELRLYQDKLGPNARAEAALEPAFAHVLYIVQGRLRVRPGKPRVDGRSPSGIAASLSANSAWGCSAAADLSAGSEPTLLLRWELAICGTAPTLIGGQDVDSRLVLAATVRLVKPQGYLLRCDRVDFPPGGEALLHTHQGPGIRCLLSGTIRIETKGAVHQYGPLEAWFEAGPDPVYAAAATNQPTAFARVMILPAQLLGKSSIQYVRAEDLTRPKSQSYQVFVDEPITVQQD